jgi:hypothetical protein
MLTQSEMKTLRQQRVHYHSLLRAVEEKMGIVKQNILVTLMSTNSGSSKVRIVCRLFRFAYMFDNGYPLPKFDDEMVINWIDYFHKYFNLSDPEFCDLIPSIKESVKQEVEKIPFEVFQKEKEIIDRGDFINNNVFSEVDERVRNAVLGVSK